MRQIIISLLAATTIHAAPLKDSVAGPGLPEPPQQKKAWTPPKSEVPDAFVTAVAKLFELGLADPRGCEYRAVTVAIPSRGSPDPELVKTHAWALPAAAGVARRYAVCWDGLVHLAIEVGPPADLDADVQTVVKRHAAAAVYGNLDADSRWLAISHQRDLSVKHDSWLADTAVALLLRLGDGARATDLWNVSRAEAQADERLDPPEAHLHSSAWKMFNQGLTAHLNGDDRLALASFRLSSVAKREIEAAALRRGSRSRNGRSPARANLDVAVAGLLLDQLAGLLLGGGRMPR